MANSGHTKYAVPNKSFLPISSAMTCTTFSARLLCLRNASTLFKAVCAGHMQGSKFRPKLVQVSHSGAGTVAAAMAAGVPQVACPLLFDQPFWARPSPPGYVSPSPRRCACLEMPVPLLDE